MKNYQKENCSGKAQHFTRPLNLLFKEHPAAQTRWHFTCSPGQTWQFTRQRHQFTSTNYQFTKFTSSNCQFQLASSPSSPDSGTSRGHPHCFSLLQLNLCSHLTYKYVANCVQNFHIYQHSCIKSWHKYESNCVQNICAKLCLFCLFPKLSNIHLSTDKHEVAARRNDLGDQMSEVGFKTSCCFLSIIKLQSYWMEDIAKILTL